MLSHLRRAYNDSFPFHITIFDSGPGQFSPRNATNAVVAGLSPIPRAIIYPFFLLLTLLYPLWYIGRADGLRKHSNVHNKSTGEVRRSYIYSTPDKIVCWKDVIWHAEDAKKKGYNVSTYIFSDSSHVGHMRADGERYWSIVKKTWSGESEHNT
jgi:hypothetical protein